MLGTCRNPNTDRNLHLERRLKMLNGRQEDNPAPLSNNGIRRAFVEIAQKDKTPENARLLTECLRSYIIQQPHAVKRSEVFLNWAHRNILFVHSFCCQVADITKRYILDHYMIEVLKTYVRLECEFSKESEERVTKLLWSIYKKYCFYSINQSSENIVWEMIYRFLTFELPTNIPKLNAILDIIRDFLPAEPSHPELPYYTKNTIGSRTFEPSKVAHIDLTGDDEIESKKGNEPISITRKKDNSENLDEELSARLGQLPRLSHQANTEVRRPAQYTRPRGFITRTNLRVNTVINLVDDSDDEDDELIGRGSSRPQSKIAMRVPDDDASEILTPRQDVVETDSLGCKVKLSTDSSGFTESVEDKDIQTLPSGRTTKMNCKVTESEWPRNYEGACAYQERRFTVGNALWRNDISMRTNREDVEVPFSVSDCSQMSSSSQDYIPVEPDLCLINDNKSRICQASKKDSSTQTLQLLDEGCQTDETLYFCHSSHSSNSSIIRQSSSMRDTFNHRTSVPMEKSNKVQKSVIDPVNLYESFCHRQKEINDRRGKHVLHRSIERVRTLSGSSLEKGSLLAADQPFRSKVQPHLHRMCRGSLEINTHLEDVNYDTSDRIQKSVISNELLCEYCHHQKGSENNPEGISRSRPLQRVENLSKDYSKQDASLFRGINSLEIREQARKLPTSHRMDELLNPGLNKQENINKDAIHNDIYHYQKKSESSSNESSLRRPFERFGNITADLSNERLSQQSKTLQLNKRSKKLSVDVTEKMSSPPQYSSPGAGCSNTNTTLSCTDENSVNFPATVFLDICSPKHDLDLLQPAHDLTKRRANTYAKETLMNLGQSELIGTGSERFSKTSNFPGRVSSQENLLYEAKTKRLANSQNHPNCADTSGSNTSESFLTLDTSIEDTSQISATKAACQEIPESVNLILEGNAETKTNELIPRMRRTTADLVSSSTDVKQPVSTSDLVEKLHAKKLLYNNSLQSSSSIKPSASSEWANHPSRALSEYVSENLQIESADRTIKSSIKVSAASETERSTQRPVRKVNPENSVSSTNTVVSLHVVDDYSIAVLEDQGCIESRDSKVPTDIANSTSVSVHNEIQMSLGEFSTVKSTDVHNSQVGARSAETSTSPTPSDSQRSLFIASVDKLSKANLQKSDVSYKPVNIEGSQEAGIEKSSLCPETQDLQLSANISLFSKQANQDNFQVCTDSEKSDSVDEQINEKKYQTLKDVKSSKTPLQQGPQGFSSSNPTEKNIQTSEKMSSIGTSPIKQNLQSPTHGGSLDMLNCDKNKIFSEFLESNVNHAHQGLVNSSYRTTGSSTQHSSQPELLSDKSNKVESQVPMDVVGPSTSPTQHDPESEVSDSMADELFTEGSQTLNSVKSDLLTSLLKNSEGKPANEVDSRTLGATETSFTSLVQQGLQTIPYTQSTIGPNNKNSHVFVDFATSSPCEIASNNLVNEAEPITTNGIEKSVVSIELSPRSYIERDKQTSPQEGEAMLVNEVDLKGRTAKSTTAHVAQVPQEMPREISVDNEVESCVSGDVTGLDVSPSLKSLQTPSDKPTSEVNFQVLAEEYIISTEPVLQISQDDSDGDSIKNIHDSSSTLVQQNRQTCLQDRSSDVPSNNGGTHVSEEDRQAQTHSHESPIKEDEVQIAVKFEKSSIIPECSILLSDRPSTTLNLTNLCAQIATQDCSAEEPVLIHSRIIKRSSSIDKSTEPTLSPEVDEMTSEDLVRSDSIEEQPESPMSVVQDLSNNDVCQPKDCVTMEDLNNFANSKQQVKDLVQPSEDLSHDISEIMGSDLTAAYSGSTSISEKLEATPVAILHLSQDSVPSQAIEPDSKNETSTEIIDSEIAFASTKKHAPDQLRPVDVLLEDVSKSKERDKYTEKEMNSPSGDFSQGKEYSLMLLQENSQEHVLPIQKIDVIQEFRNSSVSPEKLQDHPEVQVQNFLDVVRDSGEETKLSVSVAKLEENSAQLLQKSSNENISRVEENNLCREYEHASSDLEKYLESSVPTSHDLCYEVVSKVEGHNLPSKSSSSKERTDSSQVEPNGITMETSFEKTEKQIKVSESLSPDSLSEVSSERRTNDVTPGYECIPIIAGGRTSNSAVSENYAVPESEATAEKQIENQVEYISQSREHDSITDSSISEKVLPHDVVSAEKDNSNVCSSALSAYYHYVSLFLEEERKASGIGDMIPDPFEMFSIATTQQIDSERTEYSGDVKQRGSSKEQVKDLVQPSEDLSHDISEIKGSDLTAAYSGSTSISEKLEATPVAILHLSQDSVPSQVIEPDSKNETSTEIIDSEIAFASTKKHASDQLRPVDVLEDDSKSKERDKYTEKEMNSPSGDFSQGKEDSLMLLQENSQEHVLPIQKIDVIQEFRNSSVSPEKLQDHPEVQVQNFFDVVRDSGEETKLSVSVAKLEENSAQLLQKSSNENISRVEENNLCREYEDASSDLEKYLESSVPTSHDLCYEVVSKVEGHNLPSKSADIGSSKERTDSSQVEPNGITMETSFEKTEKQIKVSESLSPDSLSEVSSERRTNDVTPGYECIPIIAGGRTSNSAVSENYAVPESEATAEKQIENQVEYISQSREHDAITDSSISEKVLPHDVVSVEKDNSNICSSALSAYYHYVSLFLEEERKASGIGDMIPDPFEMFSIATTQQIDSERTEYSGDVKQRGSSKEQVKDLVQPPEDLSHDISEIKGSDLTAAYSGSTSISEKLEAIPVAILHLSQDSVPSQVIEPDSKNETSTEIIDSEIAFASTKKHASDQLRPVDVLEDDSKSKERDKYTEKEMNSPSGDFSQGKEDSLMLLQENSQEHVLPIQKIDVIQEFRNSSVSPQKLQDHPEVQVQNFFDVVRDNGEETKLSVSVAKLEENSAQLLQKSSNENISRVEENNLCREYENASSDLEKYLESSVPTSHDLCYEVVSKVEGDNLPSKSADIGSSKERTDSSQVEPNGITRETSFEKTEKQIKVSESLSPDSLSEVSSERRTNDVTPGYECIPIIAGGRTSNSAVSENYAVPESEATAEKQIENQVEYISQSREHDAITDSSISEKVLPHDVVSVEKDNSNICSSALSAYYHYVSLFLEEERKASGIGDMISDPFEMFSIATTQQIDSERTEYSEDVKQRGSSKEQVEQIELQKTVNHIDEDALLEEREGYLGSYKEMDEEMLLQEESEKDTQSSCPKRETVQQLSSEGNKQNDSNKTVIDSEVSVETTEGNVESETKNEKNTSDILKSQEVSGSDTDQIIPEYVHNENEVDSHTTCAILEPAETVIEEASAACDEKENRTELATNNVPKSEHPTSACESPSIKISNVVLKPSQWAVGQHASLFPLKGVPEVGIPDDLSRNSPQIEDPGSDRLEPVQCSEQEQSRREGLVADNNVIETAETENDSITTGNTFRDLREVETLVYTPGYSVYTQDQLMILKDDSSRTRGDPRKDIYALRYNPDDLESDVLNLSSSVKHSDNSSYVTVSNITETRHRGQIVKPTVFAEQSLQSVQPTAFVEQPIQSNDRFLNNNVLDWCRSGASEIARVIPTIFDPLNLILDAENRRRTQETIESCSSNHFHSTCQDIGGTMQKTIVEPTKVPCNYFQEDHSCSDNKLMTLAGIALQYGNSDTANSGDITLRHGNSEATDSSDSEMKLKIDEGCSSPETVENNWKAAQNKVPVTPKRLNKKRKAGTRSTPKRCRTKAELKCMPAEEKSSNVFSDDELPLTVRLRRTTPSQLFLSQIEPENAQNIPYKKNVPSPSLFGASKRGRPKSSVHKGEKPSASGACSKSGAAIRRRSSPELQKPLQKDKTSPEPAYTSKLRSRSQSTSDKEKVKETNIVHSKQKLKKVSTNSEDNIKCPKIIKSSIGTSNKKDCIVPAERIPGSRLEIPGNHTTGRLPSKPSLSLSEETFSKHTLASSPPKKRYFLLEKKNPYLEERTKRLEERLKGKEHFDQNNEDVNFSHTDFHNDTDAVPIPELIKSHVMENIDVPKDDGNIPEPKKVNVESTTVQEITISSKSEDNEVGTYSDVPSSPDDLPLSQLKLSVLTKIAANQAKEDIKFTTPKEVETNSSAKNKNDNIHLLSEIKTEISKQDSVKSAMDFPIYDNEFDNEIIGRSSLEHEGNSAAQSNEPTKNSQNDSDIDRVSIVESLIESSEDTSNKLDESNVILHTEFKTDAKADTLANNNSELAPLSAEKIIPTLQNNIETIKSLEVKIEKYDVTKNLPNCREIPVDKSQTDSIMKSGKEEMSVQLENDNHREPEINNLIESNKKDISAYPESETQGNIDSVVQNKLNSEILSDIRSMDFDKAATSSNTLNKPLIDTMVADEHVIDIGNINDKEHCPNDFPTDVALSETVHFEYVDDNLVGEIYDENIHIVSNEVVVGENNTEVLHDGKEEQLLEARKDDIKSDSFVNIYDLDGQTATTSETCFRESSNSSSSMIDSPESSTKCYTKHSFSIAKIMQSSTIDNKFVTEVKIDSQFPEIKVNQANSPELPISSTVAQTVECGIDDVRGNDDTQSIKYNKEFLSSPEESLNVKKDEIVLKEGPENYTKRPFDVECNQDQVKSEKSDIVSVSENSSGTKVDRLQENLKVSENEKCEMKNVTQTQLTGTIENDNFKFEPSSEDFFDISNYEIIDETASESIEATSDTISNKSVIEDGIQSDLEGNSLGNIPDLHSDISVPYSDFETCEKQIEKTVPNVSVSQPDIVEFHCPLSIDESVNVDISQSEYEKSGLDHPDLCHYESEIEVHSEDKMDEFSQALAHLNTSQDNVCITNDDSTASANANNDVEDDSGINFQVASEIVIHENTSVKVVSYRQTSIHNDLDSNSLLTNVSTSQDSDSEIEVKQNISKKRKKDVSSRKIIKEESLRDDKKTDKPKNVLEIKSSSKESKPSKSTMAVETLDITPKDIDESRKKSYDTIEKVKESKDRPKDSSRENYKRRITEKSEKSTSKTSLGRDAKNETMLDINKDRRQSSKKYDSGSKARERSRSSREKSEYSRDKGRRSYDRESKTTENEIKKSRNSDSLEKKLNNHRSERDKDAKSKVSQRCSSKESNTSSKDDRQCDGKIKREEKSSDKELRISEQSNKNDQNSKVNECLNKTERKSSSSKPRGASKDLDHRRKESDEDLKKRKLSNQLEDAKSSVDSPKLDIVCKDSSYRAKTSSDGLRRSERFNLLVEVKRTSDSLKPNTLSEVQSKNSTSNDQLKTEKNSIVAKTDISNPDPTDKVKKFEEVLRRTEMYGPPVEDKSSNGSPGPDTLNKVQNKKDLELEGDKLESKRSRESTVSDAPKKIDPGLKGSQINISLTEAKSGSDSLRLDNTLGTVQSRKLEKSENEHEIKRDRNNLKSEASTELYISLSKAKSSSDITRLDTPDKDHSNKFKKSEDDLFSKQCSGEPRPDTSNKDLVDKAKKSDEGLRKSGRSSSLVELGKSSYGSKLDTSSKGRRKNKIKKSENKLDDRSSDCFRSNRRNKDPFDEVKNSDDGLRGSERYSPLVEARSSDVSIPGTLSKGQSKKLEKSEDAFDEVKKSDGGLGRKENFSSLVEGNKSTETSKYTSSKTESKKIEKSDSELEIQGSGIGSNSKPSNKKPTDNFKKSDDGLRSERNISLAEIRTSSDNLRPDTSTKNQSKASKKIKDQTQKTQRSEGELVGNEQQSDDSLKPSERCRLVETKRSTDSFSLPDKLDKSQSKKVKNSFDDELETKKGSDCIRTDTDRSDKMKKTDDSLRRSGRHTPLVENKNKNESSRPDRLNRDKSKKFKNSDVEYMTKGSNVKTGSSNDKPKKSDDGLRRSERYSHLVETKRSSDNSELDGLNKNDSKEIKTIDETTSKSSHVVVVISDTPKTGPGDNLNKPDDSLRKSDRYKSQSETKRSIDSSASSISSRVQSKKLKKSEGERETQRSVESSRSYKSSKDPVDKIKNFAQGLRRSERNSPSVETRKSSNSSANDKSSKDQGKKCKQTDDELNERNNQIAGGNESRESNKCQNQNINKLEGYELRKSVLRNQEVIRKDGDSSNAINKNENKKVEKSDNESKCEHLPVVAFENNRQQSTRFSALNVYQIDKVEETDVAVKTSEGNKQVISKHSESPKLDTVSKDPSHKVKKCDDGPGKSSSPKSDKPNKDESHRVEKTDGELKRGRSSSRQKEKSSKTHDTNISKASKKEKVEEMIADSKHFLKEQQGKESDVSKKKSDPLPKERKDSKYERKRESSGLLEKVIDKIASAKKDNSDKLCSGSSNESRTNLKEPTDKSEYHQNDQKKETNGSKLKKNEESGHLTSSRKVLDGSSSKQSAISDDVNDKIIFLKEDRLNFSSHNKVYIQNQLNETTEELDIYGSKDDKIKKIGGTTIKNESEGKQAAIISSDNNAETLFKLQINSNIKHPGERKLYIKLDNRLVDSATHKRKKRKSDESEESRSDSSSAKLKKAKTAIIEKMHNKVIRDDTRQNRKRPSSPVCLKESKKVCVEPIPFPILNDFELTCIEGTSLQCPPKQVHGEITSSVTENNATIAEHNVLYVAECSKLPLSENNASISDSNCLPDAKNDVLPDLISEINSSVSESSYFPDAKSDVLPDSGSGISVPEVNSSVSKPSCLLGDANDILPDPESGIPVPEISTSVSTSICLPETENDVLLNSESDISGPDINSSVSENNSFVIESNILPEVELKPSSSLDSKESITETNLLSGAESNTSPVSETKVFASETTWLSDTKSKEVSGIGNEKFTDEVESSVPENNISITESNFLSDVEMTALPTSENNEFIVEFKVLSDPKNHSVPISETNTPVSESNWISDAASNPLISLESDKSMTGINSIVTESNSLLVTENNISVTASSFSSDSKIDALAGSGNQVSATETDLLSDAVIDAMPTSNSDTLIVDTDLFSHAETDACVTDINIVSNAECTSFPITDNSASITETMLSGPGTNTLSVIENNSCAIEKNNSGDNSPLDTQNRSPTEDSTNEASQLSQTHSENVPEDKDGVDGNKNSLSDYLARPPLTFTRSNVTSFTQSVADQQSYENVYSSVVDSAQSIPEQQPYENVYTGVLDFFGITETIETTSPTNPDLLDFAFENAVTLNSSSFSNSEMQLGFRSNSMETFHGSQFNSLYQGSSGDGITVSSVASSLSQTGPYQTIPLKASQGLIESTVSCASLCPTKQIGMSQYEDHSYADVVETIKKFKKSVQGSPVPTSTEPVVVARTSAINSLIMETGGVEYSDIVSPSRAVNSEIANTSIETAHTSSGIYQDKSSNCITVSSVESTISQTTSYQTIPLCTSQDLSVRTINSATLQGEKENPVTDHTSTMDSMIGGLKSDSELVETTLDIGNSNCSISSISGSLESDSVLDESNLQPALDLFSFQNDRSRYNDIRFLKNIIEEVTGGDSEPDLSYSFEMTDAGPRLLESERKSTTVPNQVKKTKKQVQPTQPLQPRQPVQVQPTQPLPPNLLEIPTRTSLRKKMHPPPRRKEAQPIVRAESNIRVKPPQALSVVQGPKTTPKEDVRKSPRIQRSVNHDSEVCDSLAEARLRAEKFSMPVVDLHPDDLTSKPPPKINIPTSTPLSTCRESLVRLETRTATRDYQQAIKLSRNETKIELSLDPFDQLKNEQPNNPYFKQRNNSRTVSTKKQNDNKRLKTHHSEDSGQSSPFDDTSDDICWPTVENNMKYRGTHQAVESKSEPYKLGGFEEPYREPSRSAADDRIPHLYAKEETVTTQNRKTDPHTPIIEPPVKSGSTSVSDRRDNDQYDWLVKFSDNIDIDNIRLHGANFGTYHIAPGTTSRKPPDSNQQGTSEQQFQEVCFLFRVTRRK